MVRCEEIFRQICWLEERFWPDVDGMGEEDESARSGPQVEIGGMNNAAFTGPTNQVMNAPMNNNTMANHLKARMANNGMNGPINGPMNPNGMNGSMATALNAAQMAGPAMNTTQMNGPTMNGSNTPGPDGGNNFVQMAPSS
jgi:hypothetical protein